MMKFIFILLSVLLLSVNSFAQNRIFISEDNTSLNTSVTNKFTLYESEKDITISEFLANIDSIKSRELTRSVENLDFTTSCFFIRFEVLNYTNERQRLILETARPITNGVLLQGIMNGQEVVSGDAIDFTDKSIQSNKTLLPIELGPNEIQTYVLKLQSDGEIISLPMIFWEEDVFAQKERVGQFYVGIFYGIFLFVVIIYLTFSLQLKDGLFVLYTFYVLFSGLLQFALDGYVHQYLFTSGGYWTQHSVILIAGFTVFFALFYARRYLALEGRIRKVTTFFIGVVALTMLLSLIPGTIYKTCYPLINGFSLLAVILLLISAINIRRRNPEISRLFLLGLFALLAGAVIFILGNFSVIDIPELTQNALKVGTLVEVICLSILMAGKYKSLQQEKEKAQQQLMVQLEEKNRLIQETNIRLEQEVADRTKEIEQQRLQLKEKNEDLVASITYAERIQSALLSNEDKFKSILPKSFIIYKPKDIVSGDFYWIEEIQTTDDYPKGLVVYATADCTGHGVPGAFVSIVCNNLLKLGKTEPSVNTPGEALDFVDSEINETLNSKYGNRQIRDGMDIALCAIDFHHQKLYFSGAKNGVYIVRNGELTELKGDRHAIGLSDKGLDEKFTTQEFSLESGDLLYTFSDGFVDQFGGPRLKKFTSKRLKELLLEIASLPVDQQKERLEQAFEEWRADQGQVDDVLLIGVQIP